MSGEKHKGWHSRGYLPHFDTPERAQHIVFRVAGPLPKAVLACTSKQQRTQRLDDWLDSGEGGSPLAQPDDAKIVAESLRAFVGERYHLHAWCVMPNHVHTLMTLHEGFRLGGVIGSWKSFTSRRINRARGGAGRFWAHDYFDRYMRDETDFANTVAYIENNPVVAGTRRTPRGLALVLRREDVSVTAPPWTARLQARTSTISRRYARLEARGPRRGVARGAAHRAEYGAMGEAILGALVRAGR